MNKKRYWAAFIIASAIPFFGVRYSLDQSRQARIIKDIEAGFALTEEALSAELPLRIDEHTVLARVEADGMIVSYDYIVNDVEDMGDQDKLIDVFRPLVAADVCNRVDMVRFVGYGARFVYNYSFEDGRNIGSFEFTKTICATTVTP